MIEKLYEVCRKNKKNECRTEFFLSEKDGRVFIKEGNIIENPAVYQELYDYLRLLNEKEEHSIKWGCDSEIYLDKEPYIFELLKKLESIKSTFFGELKFNKKKSRLKMILTESEDRFFIDFDKVSITDMVMLSEKYFVHDSKIYEIEPIGLNYLKVKFLEKEVKKEKAAEFISVFLTFFKNIDIEIDGYTIEEKKENRECVLILEKIDGRKNLYLSVNFEGESVVDPRVDYNVTINFENKKCEILSGNEIEVVNEKADYLESIIQKYEKGGKVKGKVFRYKNSFILPEICAEDFLTSEIFRLIKEFKIVGSEKIAEYKLKPVKPQVFINMKNGIDFIGKDSYVEVEGEKIDVKSVIESFKKNKHILLSDGTKAVIDNEFMEKINRVFDKKSGNSVNIFDFPLLYGIGEIIPDKNYEKLKKVYNGFNEISAEKAEKLNIMNTLLRDYQMYGYNWMSYIYESCFGGCLADDMGLGKTVQAISLLSRIYPGKKSSSLIVMPKSLVFNWENEIKKIAPDIKTYTYYGQERALTEAKKADVIITTYGTVRNDIEFLKNIKYEIIILDEAQSIKNVNSMIFKNIISLNAKSRFALSGTPVENNIFEVYAIFKFLNPEMFGTMAEFSRDYALPIQRDGDSAAAEELRSKIYPFILRRTKKDVLSSLPDKIEKVMYVEMDEKHREYYEERRKYYSALIKKKIEESGISKTRFFVLQALGELRQIATAPEAKTEGAIVSSKQELLIENILDAVSNDHRVLVFTNYLSVVDTICKKLDEYSIKNLSMTGKSGNRKEIVEEFQSNKEYKVLVMTLKTGGVGLNLTSADMVFIYDPWWNKSAEMQAVDRAHRMGQDKTVFSYKFITRNSIEEKILMLQQKKSELFQDIIKSDGTAVKMLSSEEIEYILGE